MDVQVAHDICQTCRILLLEADSNSLYDLATAVNTAAAMGAASISNSYGTGEWSGEASFDSYYNHPGVAVVAASGDGGEIPIYPSVSPDVVSVGGTDLHVYSDGTYVSESAWPGGGSGCSSFESANPWQLTVADWSQTACGTSRAAADVSADAYPGTGAGVYDSTPYLGTSGWWQAGGTSLSAPIVAATFPLAGGVPLGVNAQQVVYEKFSGGNSHDVTTGVNGYCGTVMCTAVAGYDGPTGLGTPNGTAGFSGAGVTPPSHPDFQVSATRVAGSTSAFTVAIGAEDGYSSPVNLTVSGLPWGATASWSANPAVPTSGAAASTLTVTTSGNISSGTYPLTITGTGTDASRTSHSVEVSLTVVAPPWDFQLAVSPMIQTVQPGHTGNFIATLTPSGSYNSSVRLSVTGLPASASASFSHSSVVPASGGSGVTLQVKVGNNTPGGDYTLTVTGAGTDPAQKTHTTQVTLAVPGFSVALAQPSLSVQRGAQVTNLVTITGLGGYTGPVKLSVGGLPTGTSATWNANPVTPAAAVTLTVTAQPNAGTGTRNVTVTASGSGVAQQRAALALTVTP